MRSELISCFAAIAFAIVGYVLPIMFPHLDGSVGKVLLGVAGLLFLAIPIFWLKAKKETAATSQSGDGSNQFNGMVSGPVHIGDVHHHAKEEWPGVPWPVAKREPREPMAISRGALAAAGGGQVPLADMRLEAVLSRVYKIMGPSPTDEDGRSGFKRRINLELADKAYERNMSVWARSDNQPRDLVRNGDLKFASFDHSRKVLFIRRPGRPMVILSDVMFNKSEVDEVWPKPPENQAGDMS
jgi:hypothetical protein